MNGIRFSLGLVAFLAGWAFSHSLRQPAKNTAMVSRLTTLEREVAEIRAQSRANVMRALPHLPAPSPFAPFDDPRIIPLGAQPTLKIEIP